MDLSADLPLVLDLDGTLVLNDLTHELIAGAALLTPLRFPSQGWLGLRGDKPEMKRRMLERLGHRFDPAHLPYNPTVLSIARAHDAKGGRVYLCSGSHEDLVHAIVDHLPELDGGWGTREGYNMTSSRKAAFLTGEFPDGFIYAGNSTQDLKVWAASEIGLAVNPPPEFADVRTVRGEPVVVIDRTRGGWRGVVEGLRSRAWWLLPVPALIVFVLGAFTLGSGVGATLAATVFATAAGAWLASVVQAPRLRARGVRSGVAGGRLGVPVALGLAAVSIVGAMAASLLAPPIAALAVLALFIATLLLPAR